MQKFSMTCSCGDVMEVEAETLEEAKMKLKEMMSEDAIKAHFDEKHPGQPVITKDQADMMIDQTMQAA